LSIALAKKTKTFALFSSIYWPLTEAKKRSSLMLLDSALGLIFYIPVPNPGERPGRKIYAIMSSICEMPKILTEYGGDKAAQNLVAPTFKQESHLSAQATNRQL
jgi:hypothetical protein